MRTEARNAVAEQTLSVKEALLLMTRAKSGQRQRGQRTRQTGRPVFTDGDLRRRMANDDTSWRGP